MRKTAKIQQRPWALVTGASRGIGAAICHRLSQKGWSLILVSRRMAQLKDMAAQLDTETLCLKADLGSKNQVDKLCTQVKKHLGRQGLKALVNNAGIYERREILKTPEKTWETQLAVNLFGPLRLSRGLYPLLKKASPASIVNISSTLGYKPVPLTAPYSATKAALNNLTQAMALEWAPDIRVNAVCPGIIDTPIHGFHGLSESDEARKQIHKLQPLGRMGHPSDIAAAVDFLISEDSKWTTGSLLTVDGGIQLL